MTTVIGQNSCMIGEIKTVHLGKGYKIRDIDVYANDESWLQGGILKSVKDFDGIDVIEVVDIVEETHMGGKIETVPTVSVETIDDLKIVYTPRVSLQFVKRYTRIPNLQINTPL